MILLGAGGVALVVYVTHLEEVPYTHRKHFVLVSPSFEKALGIQQFQQVGTAVFLCDFWEMHISNYHMDLSYFSFCQCDTV